VCKFLRKCFHDFYPEAAAVLSAVTGWTYTADEIRQTGERINTLKKVFNIREQWQPEDDWLPARQMNETLSTGVARGVGLESSELREMISGYYSARGWDAAGFVPQDKLDALGLDLWSAHTPAGPAATRVAPAPVAHR